MSTIYLLKKEYLQVKVIDNILKNNANVRI